MTEPLNGADASREPRPGWAGRLAFIGFSLAVAVLLLVVCDVLVRVSGLDRPQLSTPLMPEFGEQFRAVHRNDDLVFYSLKPSIRERFGPVVVSTNSKGFRSPEFGEKVPGEIVARGFVATREARRIAASREGPRARGSAAPCRAFAHQIGRTSRGPRDPFGPSRTPH